jgi:hypothetical protein
LGLSVCSALDLSWAPFDEAGLRPSSWRNFESFGVFDEFNFIFVTADFLLLIWVELAEINFNYIIDLQRFTLC